MQASKFTPKQSVSSGAKSKVRSKMWQVCTEKGMKARPGQPQQSTQVQGQLLQRILLAGPTVQVKVLACDQPRFESQNFRGSPESVKE